MKHLMKYAIGLAAIGGMLALLPQQARLIKPAQAATLLLCAPEVSAAASGSRTITVTSSTATPQPTYTLNAYGCGLIAQADAGFFLAQGFTQISSQNTILFTTGVAAGTTNFVAGQLPASAYIQKVVVSNATANAVTGGVSIGSTANGTDIVAAATCGANCLNGDITIAKSAFSTTAATTLNVAAVTAWNNANVTVTVVFAYF